MAGRIRTLKPEWLESEALGCCSDSARTLSVALILLADDYGNGRGAPGYLAGAVWAYREDARETVERALTELVSIGYVRFYRTGGQTYYHLPGWSAHQFVKNPSKPRVPKPKDEDFIQLVAATESRLPRLSVEPPPTLTLDPIRSDHDPTHAAAAARVRARDPSVPDPAPGPSPVAQLWAEYKRLSERHGLAFKEFTPGDEGPIRKLLREDGWTVEQTIHALQDLADQAATDPKRREWWDGKRMWSRDVLREAMAIKAGGGARRGGEVVPMRPLGVRVGRAEPRTDADYEAEKGREF